MMKKIRTKSRIPEFKNREEEAHFWETHSIADFQNEFKVVKARFAKNLSTGITIRFDTNTLMELRNLAKEKGVGPTTLARMWIMEHLKQLQA